MGLAKRRWSLKGEQVLALPSSFSLPTADTAFWRYQPPGTTMPGWSKTFEPPAIRHECALPVFADCRYPLSRTGYTIGYVEPVAQSEKLDSDRLSIRARPGHPLGRVPQNPKNRRGLLPLRDSCRGRREQGVSTPGKPIQSKWRTQVRDEVARDSRYCFVSGHDFSRADKANGIGRAFSPCGMLFKLSTRTRPFRQAV